MEETNIASYEPGTFTVNIDNINYNLVNSTVASEDYPLFAHEWCHFFQDIYTISAQNGFYLWLRDVAGLTQILCSSSGETITLPLSPEKYNGFVDKYIRLNNIYTGSVDTKFFDDPIDITDINIKHSQVKGVEEDARVVAKCSLKINGKLIDLNLVALQEINAFYLQRIAESHLEGVSPKVFVSSLPTYPYHIGDLLFHKYNIECDDETKFTITLLALDTLQPVVVFLNTLNDLAEKKLDLSDSCNRDCIIASISKNEKTFCHSKEEAYSEMDKDYKQWINMPNSSISVALKWYLSQIMKADALKIQFGFLGIANIIDVKKGVECLFCKFPIPLFRKNGILFPPLSAKDDDTVSAYTIWMLKRVCELLSCQDINQLGLKSKCPFFNHCPYKSDLGKEYECATSYWSILQGETKTKCPMGLVLNTMGLWQNKIEISR